ncbi:amino acid transporter [Pseudomonas putida]|nr:hypothetical protein [Pseudomonas sp. G5(2012)]KEX92264.1 amino acid transporter [Pseudomonas putida]
MEYIDLVQWPAMVVTVISAWFVGSQRPRRRMIAFWGFIASNALWVVWGLHSHAYALIVLECVLLGMNARGFRKNLKGLRSSQDPDATGP